eukprot:Skav236006  [mRNA]  locus=scaffold1815:55441:56433:- [translate_table: standard]
MELHTAICDRIWSLLKDNCLRSHICPHVDIHNVIVTIGEVVKMTSGHNIVNCKLEQDDNQYMRKSIFGRKLDACDCVQSDDTMEIHVQFSDAQWNLIASRYEKVILIGGFWDGQCLDVSGHTSAVIPTKRMQEDQPNEPEMRVLEMFSGGFGGWSQAAKALSDVGIPFHVAFAIDKEESACDTFMKTHQMDFLAHNMSEAWTYIKENDLQSMISTMLFCSPIQHKWWLTIAMRTIVECVCFSAPCPAWSTASTSPGLDRYDGMLFLVTITILAFIRPKIWASENVAAITKHKYFKYLLDVIQWANYRVVWSSNLDLAEVLPHQHDRSGFV